MDEIFHFRWGKDPSGYKIVKKKKRTMLDSVFVTRLEPQAQPENRSFHDAQDIHRRLLTTEPTPEGVLQFTCEYGVLGSTYDDFAASEQSVSEFLHYRSWMKDTLGALDGGDRTLATRIYNLKITSSCTVMINPAKPRRLRSVVVPNCLRDFIGLQLSNEILNEIKLVKCNRTECNEYFRVGIGEATSRRKYCSAKCRVYDKRSRDSKTS